MFEILPNPSPEMILAIARAVLLIAAFWIFALAFMRWRRADERQAQHLQAQLERAFVEVRSLHETIAVMSARIESLTERAEADTRLAPAGAASSQRGYDLATRLAKNGAGVEELIATCGITRYEAELLTRLHARTREPATGWPGRSAATEAPPPGWPAPGATAAPQAQPVGGARKRGSLLSVVG